MTREMACGVTARFLRLDTTTCALDGEWSGFEGHADHPSAFAPRRFTQDYDYTGFFGAQNAALRRLAPQVTSEVTIHRGFAPKRRYDRQAAAFATLISLLSCSSISRSMMPSPCSRSIATERTSSPCRCGPMLP